MADHSHNWYDDAIPRERINNSPDNVDTVQASFKGAYLTKECPLKKEDKAVEQSKYIGSLKETIIKFCEDSIKKQAADDEWIRKSLKNTESNIRALKTTTKNLHEKAYQLTQTVPTNIGGKRTKMGKGNMKDSVPRDLLHTPFLGHLKEQIGSPYRTRKTICMIENPRKVHKMKAREDEGDVDVSWDITIKDVESLRQFLTPTIHTLPNFEPVTQPYMPLGPVYDKEKIVREEEQDYDIPLHDDMMQPLTLQTVHIKPTDDDYVAPTTSPTLDKQLDEFGEECFDITRVSNKANGNLVKDIQELSDIKTYDCETFIQKLLHQVSQSSHETGKTKGEMKSHQRFQQLGGKFRDRLDP
ncbi:hypothetical protein Tco_0732698 [Tanacetum coccineum]